MDSQLTNEERKTLLAVARKGMETALQGGSYAPSTTNPRLEIRRGVFVTLKNHGELRGCLGRFDAAGIPLLQLVATMAAESATHDMRFHPVTASEIPEIDIQISILSPLRQIKDVREIVIGKHGLQIKGKTMTGAVRSGTLLPQVATEREWDVQTFLEATCTKAGLNTNAWKDPSTEICVYDAEVFGDLDYASPPYPFDEPVP
ncbi:MAG: AmmeMemoRadiSam system protein A [Candidatus Omnitrophota bacterium]|nr:MAG: AmmeMemoRadiSam system protein A [Candidatus Omnitrophota bacterium]